MCIISFSPPYKELIYPTTLFHARSVLTLDIHRLYVVKGLVLNYYAVYFLRPVYYIKGLSLYTLVFLTLFHFFKLFKSTALIYKFIYIHTERSQQKQFVFFFHFIFRSCPFYLFQFFLPFSSFGIFSRIRIASLYFSCDIPSDILSDAS